jgi:hypothetical protein
MKAAASRETKQILAGGLGAAFVTVVGHYVNLVIGDAFAALFGFLAGYLICGRLLNRTQVIPAGAASFEGRFGSNTSPLWITAGRRIAVICGALGLLLGDRLLYQVGIHGLTRKLGAVVIATAVLAIGYWITRWPRSSGSN